ncbi:phytanoyl-CoA dioxygenase family protein [Lysobacter enzymogenes]|uniref:phytanoyl-CoA dioxygenase family protein n=1 Tax=Lysobacter enzymogenes TaxID=69 RepID=UPI003748C069
MATAELGDSLDRRGFAQWPGAIGPAQLDALCAQPAVAAAADADAGDRELLRERWCGELAALLRARLAAAGLLAADAVAAQCTLFRKSASRNWKVTLHQDLSIPVAAPADDPRLQAWSRKRGRHFVQPPAELLQRLLAVRLHLDDCGAGDGPLRVVAGSHRHGRLDAAAAQALRAAHGETACTAARGDLLIMRPLLLHASSKATRPEGRRRVLHFLYGPREIGYSLHWSTAI